MTWKSEISIPIERGAHGLMRASLGEGIVLYAGYQKAGCGVVNVPFHAIQR